MHNSALKHILERNDRFGERGIAVVQALIAAGILLLHLLSAVNNAWNTLNPGTLLCVGALLVSSAYRYHLSHAEKFEDSRFQMLTIADGLILFCTLLSYNIAYGLAIGATFKAPSNIVFVIYVTARIIRFDPRSILTAGGIVIGGWIGITAIAVFNGAPTTDSYTEFLFSQKILYGAVIETGLGFLCFLAILTATAMIARNFLKRAALVDQLEEANQRARASAQSFENLFSASSDGIIICDENGMIERLNPSVGRVFGYQPEELVGGSVAKLMNADNAAILRDQIGQFVEMGSSELLGRMIETRGHHKDGSVVDIELSITPFASSGKSRFAGFVRDISQRKEAERIRRKAEAQFHSAVDAAMDAIVILDETGKVTGFNPAAEDLFGFDREEMIGRSLSETIIPERYRQAHNAGMKRYLETGEAKVVNSRIEIEGWHKKEGELQLELAIREIDGLSGKMFFGYARDISDRKQAETQLVNAKNEAERATRQKARFLAIMSHEIRTALNGMLGVVSLIGDTRLDDEQKRLISVAEDSGRSLLGIINDILDFSKLEAGKFEIESNPFQLELLINSVRDVAALQAEKKGLVLDLRIEEGLADIYSGDADRIRQVLLNLVWNAIKFTETGGIDVAVSQCPESTVSCLKFVVTDTGVGVPENKKDQLFAEFATINGTQSTGFQGTGLGLSIAKAFVEAMDGRIGYEDRADGSGSVFWFEIPIETTQSPVLEQNRTVVYSPSFKGLEGIRLLVADDNLTNQLIVKRCLVRAGANVDLANNGLEAVEYFKQTKYDLVLMDISMPEMNGYEASAAIRRLSTGAGEVPIIAFTAYATEQDKQEILARGMDDHVTKPFSRDHLIATILKHLPNLASREKPVEGDGDGPAPLMIAKLAEGCGFDADILKASLDGMDDEMIGEIIAQFSADLGRYLKMATLGIADSDWEALERASHGLKGTAGMFGAVELRDMANRVNLMCRNGMFEKLKQEAEHLVSSAGQLMNSGMLDSVSENSENLSTNPDSKVVNE